MEGNACDTIPLRMLVYDAKNHTEANPQKTSKQLGLGMINNSIWVPFESYANDVFSIFDVFWFDQSEKQTTTSSCYMRRPPRTSSSNHDEPYFELFYS